MKFSLLTLAAAAAILGQSSLATVMMSPTGSHYGDRVIREDIQNTINAVCDLLSELSIDLGEGCRDGAQAESLPSTRFASYQELTQYCEGFNGKYFDSSYINQCRRMIREDILVSAAGLSTCAITQYEDSTKMSCLKAIEGQYLDERAAEICKSDYYQGQVGCLKAIMNKAYLPEEIQACENDVYKTTCFKNYGQEIGTYRDIRTRYQDRRNSRVQRRENGRRSTRMDEHRRDSREQLCRVVNSNNELVTNDLYTPEDFGTFAADFAAGVNQCVVANIKGMTASRVLISETGRRLTNGLTEDQMNQEKRRQGFNRCRVLTCELN